MHFEFVAQTVESFQDDTGSTGSATSGGRFDKGSSPNGKAASSCGSESPKAPGGGATSTGPRRRFGSMADDLDVAK